jgi:pimeloyl-ACP methyl ester carboxylesterase
VAATKRVLARLQGNCLLVGHSWGGMVITEVGNDERVSGLVYIAALAPDVNKSMIDLTSKYESNSEYFEEQEGFLWISKEVVAKMFADDVPPEKAALIYANQTPISSSLLTAKIANPAWKNKPSWYIIANQDKAVPPELQINLSQRMVAKTTVLESGHVPIISHASEVLAVIREAANS